MLLHLDFAGKTIREKTVFHTQKLMAAANKHGRHSQLRSSQRHCVAVNKATQRLCAEHPLNDPLLKDIMLT
jgi:hypothetical protein